MLATVTPVIVSLGVGLVFLEITTPTLEVEPKPVAVVPSWKRQENVGDPYNQLPRKKKAHSSWQGQYVEKMLAGLKDKSREQKFHDAFEALDKFMQHPGRSN